MLPCIPRKITIKDRAVKCWCLCSDGYNYDILVNTKSVKKNFYNVIEASQGSRPEDLKWSRGQAVKQSCSLFELFSLTDSDTRHDIEMLFITHWIPRNCWGFWKLPSDWWIKHWYSSTVWMKPATSSDISLHRVCSELLITVFLLTVLTLLDINRSHTL